MNTTKDTVTITRKEYDELNNDSIFLHYLRAAGVDNWEGYGEAIEMMEEENGNAALSEKD